MRLLGKESFGSHLYTQIIVQAMPPLMGQGTGPVHLGKVDDLPQRFIVGGGVAAAAGAKGNRKRSLIGNILFADPEDCRQIFERVKSHIQRRAPVILRHPVSKFTAPEREGVKIVLSDHITVPAVIRAGTPDVGKLLRDKPLLSTGPALSGKILCPFQGFLTGEKIRFQDRIAFRDIVGIGKPVVIFRVGPFAVIEPDVIPAGNLLAGRNAELLFYSLPDDFPLEILFPTEVQGIYQLIGNDGIIPPLWGGPDVAAADPVGNALTVAAVYDKGLKHIHRFLDGLDLLNGFLHLPDSRDILFLPRQTLFRRIIGTQVPRGGVQAVTHNFPKVQNIHRDAGLKQGIIIRLFPDIILFDVLFGLALIHPQQVIHIQAAGSPKIFFGAADLFAEIFMYNFLRHLKPPPPYHRFGICFCLKDIRKGARPA